MVVTERQQNLDFAFRGKHNDATYTFASVCTPGLREPSQDRDRVGRHRETNTMSDRRQGITLAAVFLSVLDTPGRGL